MSQARLVAIDKELNWTGCHAGKRLRAMMLDLGPATWSYHARATDVLRRTALPIPADRFAPAVTPMAGCSGRSAAWCADAMREQDFSAEDHLAIARFNTALWRGPGAGPEPATRDGADLRTGRERLDDWVRTKREAASRPSG